MKATFVTGLLLMVILAAGAAASVGYVAVGVKEQEGAVGGRRSFFEEFIRFAPFFFVPNFFDRSIPVTLSAPRNPNISSISVMIGCEAGSLTISFTEDAANQYLVEGRRDRYSAPPKIEFIGSTLNITLPAGMYTITLPRDLRYSIQIFMSVGELKLDAAGVDLSKLDARVSLGSIDFSIELKGGTEVMASVSTGSIRGAIHTKGVALQLTGESDVGSVSVRGSGLLKVIDTTRLKQVKTANFETAARRAIVHLQARTGSVEVRIA
jgi:hypothetical protein